MIEYGLYESKNIGVLEAKFTDEELAPIKKEIEEIQNNFSSASTANHFLVGHIKKEFLLKKSKKHIEKLILPYIVEYEKKYEYFKSLDILNKNAPIELEDPWVNFMKKHEFNPPHKHGGLFSFVIWINLPFDIEKEFEQFPDARSKSTACFNFLYTDSLGKIKVISINADKKMENTFLLFPSEMFHFVNPFYTSDEYRISVSGNFKLYI
jgi:hypothetical protein